MDNIDDKKSVIVLAENLKAEGVPRYIQKTSEPTGVPVQTIKNWLGRYRKGQMKEVEIDVLSFREGEWAKRKEALAVKATEANDLAINVITEMLKPVASGEISIKDLDTRKLKDLAQTFSLIGKEKRANMGEDIRSGGGVTAAQSTVNIVMPPKGEMPIVDGEIKIEESS